MFVIVYIDVGSEALCFKIGGSIVTCGLYMLIQSDDESLRRHHFRSEASVFDFA